MGPAEGVMSDEEHLGIQSYYLGLPPREPRDRTLRSERVKWVSE